MDKKGSTIKRTDASGSDERDAAAPPQPGLLIVFAQGKPHWSLMSIPIAEAELELGRDNLGAEVGDGRISRRHVRVNFRSGAFFATDLGSLNGTVIDGRIAAPLVERPLERCLRVGDTLLLPSLDLNPLKAATLSMLDGLVIGPQLFHLYQRIGRAAASSTTLHITGESGAGKENAARAFHTAGPGSRGPFVAVNCATIPEGIAERLLFGAKRGAFSGVVADTDGYIQAANGGTLFLDEIAELHATVQAKFLRVLESREVLALGAVRPQPVTLRVCSASHRSLHAEVAAGRLREDLYYRIGRPAERVPSIRERPEEIPWLVQGELQKSGSDLSVHVSLIEACILRHWPGNIRELLVEIRAAAQEALAAEGKRIKAEHLSATAGMAIKAQPLSPAQPQSAPPEVAPNPPPAERAADKVEAVRPSRAKILAALIEAKGNLSAAARELAIHRTQLRRDIAYHGIDVNRLREIDKT